MFAMRSRGRRHLLPLAFIGLILIGLPIAAATDTILERRTRAALGLSHRCIPATNDSPGWREEPPLATKRDEMRAVTLDGKVYLAGGLTDILFSDDIKKSADSRQRVPVRSVRSLTRFDPATGKYVELPPMPEALNHVGLVAYRGDLYVVGGHGNRLAGGDVRNGLYRYRVRERRWERLPALPQPRGALAAGVVGDRLYVAGGMVADRPIGRAVGTLEIFDFARNRWSRGPSMRHPGDHVAGVVAAGRLYVMGGRDARSDGLPYVQRFDPARGRWEVLDSLPEPTSGLDAVVAGGTIVTIGGSDERAGRLTPVVQRYDLATGRWELSGRMRSERHGAAAALVGDRVFVFGGSSCVGFEATDVVESYMLRERA